jgi:hypothetical protein
MVLTLVRSSISTVENSTSPACSVMVVVTPTVTSRVT